MENVFPLFTPEGEKKWAPGWDYTPVYPADGTVEENTTFTTSSQDHKHAEAIWVTVKYHPENYQVSYLRIEPAVKIGKIDVVCRPLDERRTAATITYTYTALSESGNAFIDTFTDDYYRQFISEWQTGLNHYLKTGQMMTESSA